MRYLHSWMIFLLTNDWETKENWKQCLCLDSIRKLLILIPSTFRCSPHATYGAADYANLNVSI